MARGLPGLALRILNQFYFYEKKFILRIAFSRRCV